MGRSPGEGNGNPLQYSCLENPHGWRRMVDYSPWSSKESDMTERLSTAQHPFSDTLLLCRSKFHTYVISSLLKNFQHLLQGSLLVINSLNLCFSGNLYLSFLQDIFARYRILRWWGIFPQHFQYFLLGNHLCMFSKK